MSVGVCEIEQGRAGRISVGACLGTRVIPDVSLTNITSHLSSTHFRTRECHDLRLAGHNTIWYSDTTEYVMAESAGLRELK